MAFQAPWKARPLGSYSSENTRFVWSTHVLGQEVGYFSQMLSEPLGLYAGVVCLRVCLCRWRQVEEQGWRRQPCLVWHFLLEFRKISLCLCFLFFSASLTILFKSAPIRGEYASVSWTRLRAWALITLCLPTVHTRRKLLQQRLSKATFGELKVQNLWNVIEIGMQTEIVAIHGNFPRWLSEPGREP